MNSKSTQERSWLEQLLSANTDCSASVPRWRSQDQLEFDMEFFARILRRNPHDTDLLRIEGELLSHSGRHEAALEIDKQLARLCPHDCVVHYNLACSLALLGDHRAAICELRRAFRYGYSDITYMQRDPDLSGLRRESGYQALVNEFTSASGEFYFEMHVDDDQ